MTPCEWYEIAEHYMSKQGIAGTSITEDEHEEMKAWAEEVKAERARKKEAANAA